MQRGLFVKKIELLLSVVIALSAVFSGCGNQYSYESLEGLSSYYDTWQYTSPDESYQLEVEYSHFGYDDSIGSIKTIKPVYTFYWREEDGLTEPLASVKARAKSAESAAFNGLGEWSQDDSGSDVFSDGKSYWITWQSDGVIVEFRTFMGKQQVELEYPDRMIRTQSFTQKIENAEKPEVVSAELVADCYGQIERKADIIDVYAKNFAVNQGPALVGSPLDISYLDSLSNVKLTFFYDEAMLGNTAEENLIVWHYDKAENRFTEMTKAELDPQANTVTVPVQKEGVYLLVDLYRLYFARGIDIRDWQLEKNSIVYDENHKVAIQTNWDREYGEDTDIQKLASLEWAMENTPEFHVTTLEQLASVVYYVNTFAEEEIQLYLENDIDLNGYAWAPMGWRKSKCNGVTIYGMGHTISNMTIDQPEKNEVGFLGFAGMLEASDLHFRNASVTGKDFVGIFCGVDYVCQEIQSVSVEGTVTSKGSRCGAIFGDESGVSYQDCIADVTVNGAEFPYYSHHKALEE